ncbi:MAG: hypothetical protein QOE92_886 [Chloroflexota bacterium]|nr:hypothetical protein [Chloroflexota bacterium]
MPRGPMKFEILRDQLAASSGSLAEVRGIATSVGVMEDRYLARPAAELLVARGAPGADRIAATLQTMPITGKDYKGDMLRAAFRTALEREGISPAVEQVARSFYERRQKASLVDVEAGMGGAATALPADQQGYAPPAQPQQPQGQPPAQPDIVQDIGKGLNDIAKKLFG